MKKFIFTFFIFLPNLLVLSCGSTKSTVSTSEKFEAGDSLSLRFQTSLMVDTFNRFLSISADSLIMLFAVDDSPYTLPGHLNPAGSERMSIGDSLRMTFFPSSFGIVGYNQMPSAMKVYGLHVAGNGNKKSISLSSSEDSKAVASQSSQKEEEENQTNILKLEISYKYIFFFIFFVIIIFYHYRENNH